MTLHVYPSHDVFEHELEGTQCWCGPRLITDEPELIVVHELALSEEDAPDA